MAVGLNFLISLRSVAMQLRRGKLLLRTFTWNMIEYDMECDSEKFANLSKFTEVMMKSQSEVFCFLRCSAPY